MGFSTSNNPNRSLVVRTASRPFTGVSASALWRAAARCGRRWSSRPFTGVSAPAVLGPAFTPGPNADGPLLPSGPFTGLLSRAARPSRGFTLVEMLVVVTIMVLLMGFAATRIVPATQSRRSREAARALNVYLSSARNRAMETGRPYGVILHRFGALPCTMSFDNYEESPYSGKTNDAVVMVWDQSSTWPDGSTILRVQIRGIPGAPPQAADFSNDTIHRGDLMQLNAQGPWYTIIEDPTVIPSKDFALTSNGGIDFNTGITVTNGWITNRWLTLRLEPQYHQQTAWTAGWSQPMLFGIKRRRTSTLSPSPLQLPAGAVVDLAASGPNPAAPFGVNDVMILFSASGSVQSISVGVAPPMAITDPIFLLVGKRERVGQSVATPTPDNRSQWANWQDLDNIWVVINPLTGTITTSNVAPGASIAASRSLATDAQGMGGK
ncbi:MAG: type II secretion system GspH family protein [Planctomycetaceae bacterium]|nr:type II secretion system GspH family protein [Planctomycetaceae bacterium]